MKVHVIVLAVVGAVTHGKLVPMTCNLIKSFVDGHNALRLSVAEGKVREQPAATDMKMMIWDEELAAKAAKWASNKKMKHNPDRTVGSGRFTIGENLYWQAASKNNGINVNKALSSWFDEHKDYKFHTLEPEDFSFATPVTGHYTQLIWADTMYVGCAVEEYEKNSFYNTLVVCNYGPMGNIIEETPYNTDGDIQDELICVEDCSHPYGSKC